MKKTLEELLSSYLVDVNLETISDNRFRCLVDLYRDLNKEQSPDEHSEHQDLELQAFLDALSKGDI